MGPGERISPRARPLELVEGDTLAKYLGALGDPAVCQFEHKLQQLHIDARHRIRNNLASTFSYLCSTSRWTSMTTRSIPAWSTASSSPARWSWDTSHRPYTANSFVFGVKYFW